MFVDICELCIAARATSIRYCNNESWALAPLFELSRYNGENPKTQSQNPVARIFEYGCGGE